MIYSNLKLKLIKTEGKMKYKDWLEKWLELYVKPTAKIRTYDKYERIVRGKLIPALGEIELTELTTLQLQEYIVNLSQKCFAVNTINGIIAVIKSSLKSAIVVGAINQNPADGLRRPKREKKEVDCFTSSEQAKIEEYIITKGKINLYGILIALYTGLRLGELLALKWQDIDLQNGTLSVNKTCYDSWINGKYRKIIDSPKTDCSRRIIPVSARLNAVLLRLKEKSIGSYVLGCGEEGAQVRNYQKTFSGLLKKLGITHKGFHSLRHTFATRAIESGMDVKTLSEILGHKNPAITLSRYVHSQMEHKREMMNRLGQYFEDISKKVT